MICSIHWNRSRQHDRFKRLSLNASPGSSAGWHGVGSTHRNDESLFCASRINRRTNSLMSTKTRISVATLSLLLGLANSAPTLALDKATLDSRIHKLSAKFEAMQQKLDRRIPPETLQKAHGIILLDRTKAGVVFAYQGGSGVALVKDTKTGNWSAPAFLEANEASLGFQLGGEQSFFAILLMNTNVTRLLTEPNFEFGGEARGTAGNESAGAAGTVASTEQQILVYDDRKGLYGGAAIKGGAIGPDSEANRVYYEQYCSMADILFGKKVKPTGAATALAAKLDEFSKSPKK
jgi:lipid-binding SYLF domain-containing protein